ncbi:uncharacterized protein LOC129621292 isoform X5 [Bubalus kerabau]|uniref:uncharacterized protein LOC129621292 isoform X5 n=1 Tax=Bubalus carabanensis TaxID=3119969 RepID=UPI00244E71E6|nr:uncharacterized protein LOC129621292 isoform X5 [Bubalus carabanensis]
MATPARWIKYHSRNLDVATFPLKRETASSSLPSSVLVRQDFLKVCSTTTSGIFLQAADTSFARLGAHVQSTRFHLYCFMANSNSSCNCFAKSNPPSEVQIELRRRFGFQCSGKSTRCLSGKESTCQCRDTGGTGSMPGSGRSPEGGNGNPLQYSCLENSMDKGALWATVHGVTKESDIT